MPARLVFFDGVCGLCDRAVSFLFERDRAHVLRFAPLQGETAARHLPADRRTPPLDTLLFLRDGRLFERSDAVLRLAGELGWPWRVALAFLVVPRSWRDAAYRRLARNRYRIFGKRAACRLPSPAERAYFLA